MNSTSFKKSIYIFALPSLILYTLFWVAPILMTFYFSFTKSTTDNISYKLTGLVNYQYLLEDGSLLNALRNTFIYAVVFVVISNTLAIALALVLNMGLKLKGVYRTLSYIPTLFSSIVVAFVWGYVYMPQDGMIAKILQAIGLGNNDPNLLAFSSTALLATVAVEIWKGIGAAVVIYLAGLQTISHELLEAGRIDGCSTWRTIVHIQIPLLAPSITLNVILGLIGGLKCFDYVFLMTQGGPYNSTETLMSSLFKMVFNEGLFAKGSALGVVSFVLLFVITAIAVTLLKKKEVVT